MTELSAPMSCSSRAGRGYRCNKSLGCIFSEKPADRTNAFKLEISSLADFYDVLLSGQV